MNKKIKWYLAGPMTGIPQFNYPLFYSAAEILREMGLQIYSPAEMDDPTTVKAAMASKDGSADDYASDGKGTWGEFLARDVKLIADELGGIILLPNWYKSKGARLEAFVSINCNYPSYEYTFSILNDFGGGLERVTTKYILERINESFF